MSEKILIHDVSINGQERSWVLFDTQILAVGVGDSWREISAELKIIDGANGFISRPMTDTHTHGGWGHSVESGVEAWREIRKHQRRNGVQKTLLSIPTVSFEKAKYLVSQAEKFLAEDSGFLGLHLEGPFLSSSQKGAHPESLLKLPTETEIEIWRPLLQSDAVVSMTIAPELFSDKQLKVLKQDLHLCFGHSAADYQTAKKFFANFGTIMTHCFNAMNSIHHRNPGPIPAAIENKNVFIELIADGVHVANPVMALIPKDRTVLVTDAISAAGSDDGEYQLAGESVFVVDSVARNQDGALAGSTLTMKAATYNFSQLHDVQAALLAADKNPGAAYGFGYEEIKSGTSAELLLWDADMNLEMSYNF